MKREIKFRGKRKDNGEFITGNLFVPNKLVAGVYICPDSTFVDFIPGFEDGDDIEDYRNNGAALGRFHEIIPETVGQYTGLKDKHGKEIYEGDIMKANYTETLKIAEWDERRGMFIGRNGFNEPLYNELYLYEIIGNIHETIKD